MNNSDEPLKVHRSVAGRGRAYHGEQLIGEVRYSLHEVEERVEAAQARVISEPTFNRSIFGLFQSRAAPVLATYIGVRLSLALEDGRRLPFTVAKYLNKNSCLIQGLDGYE